MAALQSIKGCAFALAAAFSAEVGDFTRFRSGRQVTAYFGLAPSQRSSGDSVRLGGISGAGNALVRKLAVEGSWCCCRGTAPAEAHAKDTGVPLEIRMHGRKGSERLLRRREEMLARGMPAAKANAGHRGRAREVALGPRHDVPGGRGIDIAPVPASRAAFGDTPYFAVRAEPSRMQPRRQTWEPRRRNGARADRTVSADMRLSRRRR
ncbi:MAG: transposase [Collinsella sp.]